MNDPQNIRAYFLDVATRHPSILHSATNKRFFEMEWDEMMQAGQPLACDGWTLILEDYTETYRDNNGGYFFKTPLIAFMVVKHSPQGDAEAKLATYEAAQVIALDILGKMKADEVQHRMECTADVPTGVLGPDTIDINSIRIDRVMPPFCDHAFGVRAVVKWLTDHDVELTRERCAWVQLI